MNNIWGNQCPGEFLTTPSSHVIGDFSIADFATVRAAAAKLKEGSFDCSPQAINSLRLSMW
jgi:hypothetical protein